MMEKLMMIIINKEGIITGMLDDEKMVSTDSVDELLEFVRTTDREPLKKDALEFIRHLYCARKYAEDNYPNMQLSSDDLTMYYKLTQRGNILLINSKSHVNLLFAPNNITDKQKDTLRGLAQVINPNLRWSMSDNVYLDTFEYDGKLYGTIETGDIREGNIEESVKYLVNKNKVKKF